MMEQLMNILLDINPDLNYEKETSLVDDGVFDSFEIMEIISEIEEKFGIDIDPDDIIAENFNSAKNIMKLITKRHE